MPDQIAEKRKQFLKSIDELVYEYRHENLNPRSGLDRVKEIIKQWNAFENTQGLVHTELTPQAEAAFYKEQNDWLWGQLRSALEYPPSVTLPGPGEGNPLVEPSGVP